VRDDFSTLVREPIASIESVGLPAVSLKQFEEHYNVNQAKLVMGFRVDAKTQEEINEVRLMSMHYGVRRVPNSH
jgi:hypothetical protein